MSDTFDEQFSYAVKWHREQPAWKRALWKLRAWLWPVRWCKHTRAIEVCLPVGYVASAMLGTRRWTWLFSVRRNIPVGFRVQFGGLWTWTQVWERDA